MKTRFVLAAIALLGAGTAFAGHVKSADSDGDGYVSLEEMKAAHNARIEERFAKVDSNGDGLLSEEERQSAREARREHRKGKRKHRRKMRSPEKIVERLDSDGSGSVSFEEFQNGPRPMDSEKFTAADSNGNGELDAEELGAMMAAHRAARKARWQESERD